MIISGINFEIPQRDESNRAGGSCLSENEKRNKKGQARNDSDQGWVLEWQWQWGEGDLCRTYVRNLKKNYILGLGDGVTVRGATAK